MWGYLRICYKTLRAVMMIIPDNKAINFKVVRRFLFLSQLPDKEERCEIADILGLYFDTRPAERFDLLVAVRDQLVLLREVPLIPYCGVTLLMVMRHIFAQASAEFRPAVVSVIANAVIPLVTSPDVAVFYPVLRTLILDFVAHWPRAGIGVLAKLQRLWPLTCGAREALFVNLVMHVAVIIEKTDFALTFFRFIGALFSSPNFLVVDQLLSTLDRPEGRAFLAAHRDLVARYIAGPVAELPVVHWSNEVRKKASAFLPSVLAMVAGLTPALQPDPAAVPTVHRWAAIVRAAGTERAEQILSSARNVDREAGPPTRFLPASLLLSVDLNIPRDRRRPSFGGAFRRPENPGTLTLSPLIAAPNV
jgi:hypothetical protein